MDFKRFENIIDRVYKSVRWPFLITFCIWVIWLNVITIIRLHNYDVRRHNAAVRWIHSDWFRSLKDMRFIPGYPGPEIFPLRWLNPLTSPRNLRSFLTGQSLFIRSILWIQNFNQLTLSMDTYWQSPTTGALICQVIALLLQHQSSLLLQPMNLSGSSYSKNTRTNSRKLRHQVNSFQKTATQYSLLQSGICRYFQNKAPTPVTGQLSYLTRRNHAVFLLHGMARPASLVCPDAHQLCVL